MTATFGNVGNSAAGTASINVDMPASVAAGDGLLAIIGFGESTNTVPTGPADWTLIGSFAGGGGTFGVDTGDRGVAIFWHVAAAAYGDTETRTFTIGGNVTGRVINGIIARYTRSLAAWVEPVMVGAADTTSGTDFSITPSPGWGALNGDSFAGTMATVPDTATTSAPTLTWTGTGTATMTQSISTASTNGNDIRLTFAHRACTGTSSGDPTFAYTMSAAATGAGVIVRLRDTNAIPPPLLHMAPRR